MDLLRNPDFILQSQGATEAFRMKTDLYHVFTINLKRLKKHGGQGSFRHYCNTGGEADKDLVSS